MHSITTLHRAQAARIRLTVRCASIYSQEAEDDLRRNAIGAAAVTAEWLDRQDLAGLQSARAAYFAELDQGIRTPASDWYSALLTEAASIAYTAVITLSNQPGTSIELDLTPI